MGVAARGNFFRNLGISDIVVKCAIKHATFPREGGVFADGHCTSAERCEGAHRVNILER
jgi:hypothetical protein